MIFSKHGIKQVYLKVHLFKITNFCLPKFLSSLKFSQNAVTVFIVLLAVAPALRTPLSMASPYPPFMAASASHSLPSDLASAGAAYANSMIHNNISPGAYRSPMGIPAGFDPHAGHTRAPLPLGGIPGGKP